MPHGRPRIWTGRSTMYMTFFKAYMGHVRYGYYFPDKAHRMQDKVKVLTRTFLARFFPRVLTQRESAQYVQSNLHQRAAHNLSIE